MMCLGAFRDGRLLTRAINAPLWVFVAVMILCGCAQAQAALHIEVVRAPRFVTVDMGSAPALFEHDGKQREARINLMVQQVAQEACADPERLVVVEPRGLALQYHRLTSGTQKKLSSLLGDSPQHEYESGIAAILQQVLSRVHSTCGGSQLAIAGLPVESGNERVINANYAAAIASCDAIVSARSIIVSGTGQNEAAAARRSLSEALRLADGRAIYFSCNGQWHKAIIDNSPGAVDSYPPPVETQTKPTSAQPSSIPSTPSSTPGSASASDADEGGSGGGSGGGGSSSSSSGGTGGGSGDGGGSGGGGGGGGGGGSAAGGGGGSSGGGGGSLPASGGTGGSSGTPPLLFVAQKTSVSVHSLYAQIGAKDMPVIYGAEIDPQHTGNFTHPELLQMGLNREVPIDYTGPVCLDWEDRAMENLVMGVAEDTLNRQIAEYVRLINKARELRPNAKFGFYGLPTLSLYNQPPAFYSHALKLKPIYDASDVLFPTVYRFYPANYPTYSSAENLEYVRRGVKHALAMSEGKPVYPFMWHRYHDSNHEQGYRIIPSEEFKSHVAAIFQAELNGRRAEGMVWWGADQYFYWMSTHYPHGGPPEYADGPWLAQVFADEMSPGETPQMYFNRIHRRTLKLLGEVLHALPAQ